MRRSDAVVIAMLTGVAIFAAAPADASPRAEVKAGGEAFVPVTEPAEMAAWLRRMVGRYTVEGAIQVVSDNRAYEGIAGQPEVIKGKADCVGIGTGPGVQCILNVQWLDMFYIVYPTDDERGGVYEVPDGVSYLDPSMVLFGLDPGKSEVRYLLVNQKGLPDGGPGFIVGNRATFKTPCVNTPTMFSAMKPPIPDERHPEWNWLTCERVFYLEARPNAGVVYWSLDVNLNNDQFTRIQMTLRRVQEGQASQVSTETR